MKCFQSKAKRRGVLTNSQAAQRRSRRAFFESLEDRRLLATFNVTTTEDVVNPVDDQLSLREAIIEANTNGSSEVDEIILSGRQYTLTLNGVPEDASLFGDLDVNTPVIIRGVGQGNTIIDGGGDSGIGERVFQTFGAHAVTFRDLTIQGGRASGLASSGGGIFASGGTGSLVTLERVTLTDNEASQQGGAIANATEAEVNVVLSTIDNNEVTAGDGGGIANTGTITIDRSTISNNTASGLGGGILNVDAASRVLSSTLSGNTAGSGAAVANHNSAMTMVNSTVSGNTTTGQVGGIFNISSGAGNTGSVTLLQSTVTGNTQASAGAVHALSQNGATSAVVTVGNTIIAGNTGASRNLSLFNTGGGSGAAINSLGSNLANDGANGLLNQPNDHPNVTTAVVSATLGSNGGTTLTHALVDSPTNPAIDGGSNTLAVDPGANGQVGGGDDSALVSDQRTTHTRQSGGTVDIGAVEHVTFNANDFIVNTSADTLLLGDNQVTLRDAIFAANFLDDPDTITFDQAVDGQSFNLTLGQLTITDDVTIDGNGATNTIIDGQAGSRIFDITSAAGDVTLEGITVRNGKTTGSDGDGAGIQSRVSGTLTISNSLVSGNVAEGSFAEGGGVRSFSNSGLMILDSTIADNSAVVEGGGIRITGSGATLTIERSTINGNDSEIGGGLSIADDATGVVSDTTIHDNMATGPTGGGGVLAFSPSFTVTNSTISGNSAAGPGAGLYNFGGVTVLNHSTITNNTAPDGFGSGIANDGFVATRTEVNSSIIAGNTNTDVDFVFGATNSFQSNGFNLVGTGNATSAFNNNDQTGVTDPKLLPLDDYGGQTQTHALMPDSTAIDMGDPADAAGQNGVPLLDQRGFVHGRVQNGDAVAGARIDIGAFESRGGVLGPRDVAFYTRIFERPANYPFDAGNNRVEATQEITTVEAGQDFVVKLFMEDLRDDLPEGDRGIFGAFLDVTLNDTVLASIAPTLPGVVDDQGAVTPYLFGPRYDFLQSRGTGNGFPHAIDEFGATANPFSAPSSGEFLFVEWAMTALSPGTLTITPDPPDDAGNDVLPFEGDPINPTDMLFVSDTIEILAVTNLDLLVKIDGPDIIVEQTGTEISRFTPPFTNVTVNGGPEDDTVSIDDLSSITTAPIPLAGDGGTGEDTIRLLRSNQTLDIPNLPGSLTNVEAFDITGDGANTLTLDEASIQSITDADNRLDITHDDDDVVSFDTGWDRQSWAETSEGFRHIFAKGGSTVTIDNQAAWTNPFDRFDVDGRGVVDINDAIFVVNRVNQGGGGDVVLPSTFAIGETVSGYFDVSGKNGGQHVTNINDAIFVVNEVNRRQTGNNGNEGEGQSAAEVRSDTARTSGDSDVPSTPDSNASPQSPRRSTTNADVLIRGGNSKERTRLHVNVDGSSELSQSDVDEFFRHFN